MTLYDQIARALVPSSITQVGREAARLGLRRFVAYVTQRDGRPRCLWVDARQENTALEHPTLPTLEPYLVAYGEMMPVPQWPRILPLDFNVIGQSVTPLQVVPQQGSHELALLLAVARARNVGRLRWYVTRHPAQASCAVLHLEVLMSQYLLDTTGLRTLVEALADAQWGAQAPLYPWRRKHILHVEAGHLEVAVKVVPTSGLPDHHYL